MPTVISRTKDIPVPAYPEHIREHVAMLSATGTKAADAPPMPASAPAHIRSQLELLGYRTAEPAPTAATPLPAASMPAMLAALNQVGQRQREWAKELRS